MSPGGSPPAARLSHAHIFVLPSRNERLPVALLVAVAQTGTSHTERLGCWHFTRDTPDHQCERQRQPQQRPVPLATNSSLASSRSNFTRAGEDPQGLLSDSCVEST